MSAEHKESYELHTVVVQAESLLKDAGWTSGELISYDTETPLKMDWGVRYSKGDKIIYLNRFTASTIVNLF
jgi:hypothetical protein